jgi:hypothetical protein
MLYHLYFMKKLLALFFFHIKTIVKLEWLLLSIISMLKFCLLLFAQDWALFGEKWGNIFFFLLLVTLQIDTKVGGMGR